MTDETPSPQRGALVTGGSGELGRAVAQELARDGARVCVHFNRNEDGARETVEAISGAGGTAFCLGADLTDRKAAQTLVDEAIRRLGRLDVLVNNAGTSKDGFLMMMAEEDWDHVISANLKTLYTVTRPALRHMIAERRGRIVNISSMSGVTGVPGQTNYAAAKGGVIAFTKALARELAPFNILVNAVAPGLVASKMVDEIPEPHRTAMVNAVPLKRLGTPEDVARAVSFLSSEHTQYITGEILQVSGGL